MNKQISGDTIYELSIQCDIKADFNDKEKEKLLKLYKKNEFNQYAGVVINKVWVKRELEIDEKKITALMASIETALEKSKNKSKTDKEIIATADGIYRTLMLVDIIEIYNNRF